jgi:hypothetical protein
MDTDGIRTRPPGERRSDEAEGKAQKTAGKVIGGLKDTVRGK